MSLNETKEKNFDKGTSVRKPELNAIIDKLESAVNRYDSIVCETRIRLQTLKRSDEPSPLNDTTKEKQPESVTEEINRLLDQLSDLNVKASRNLAHLADIV